MPTHRGIRALQFANAVVAKDENGRGDWIRTSDLLRPMQVRYQAAPHPDRKKILAELPMPDEPRLVSDQRRNNRKMSSSSVRIWRMIC